MAIKAGSVFLKGLKKLEKKEVMIRNFLEETMLDECGLVLSHLNVKTLRPWTNDECKKHTHSFLHTHTTDPAAYISYEDSLMATGEYAAGQIIRYEVTGEPEALAAAAHPVYAILRVLYEGEHYEKGFLPKPFGGMRTAGYSHEISVDQYIKAVVALRAYRKYASPAQTKVIDDYFVAMADYFLARNFINPRRERMVVTPENRAHGLCLYIPILVMASNITGNKKYRTPLKNGRFDKAFEILSDMGPAPFNISSLLIEGFHLAIQEGCDDPRLKPVICDQWHKSITLIAKDGYGYPYPGRKIKSSRVIRIPSFASIVSRYMPRKKGEIFKTALFVLSSIAEPKKMLYVNSGYESDPDFKSYHLARCICETSVSSWLMAYWRIKKAVSC